MRAPSTPGRLGRGLLRGCAAAAALLLVSSLALAEKAPPDARAKTLFDEGIALSDEGKWSEALEAFQRSDALVPSATVRFNIGATQRALGHYVDASHTLERLLGDAEAGKVPLKPALARDVEKVLGEVRGKIVVLTAHVVPASAELQVDGAVADAQLDGRLRLDPGRHVFVAKASGYETTTVTRTLLANEAELAITLPRRKVVERTIVVAADAPVYGRAWFWTAAGLLVAGAAVTAAVLASQPKPAAPLGPPTSTVDRVIPAGFRF